MISLIFKYLIIKLNFLINSIRISFLRLNSNIVIGRNPRFSQKVLINIHNNGKLVLKDNVRINSGNLINSFGGHRKMIIRVLRDGVLSIGNNVGMSNSTIICATSILIEDDVLIGGNCHIFDTNFHSTDYDQRMQKPDININKRPVLIKKGAFIGGGSYILKGVTIGEKSIIAAGSIISQSVPDKEIWGGNPAKFIRKI